MDPQPDPNVFTLRPPTKHVIPEDLISYSRDKLSSSYQKCDGTWKWSRQEDFHLIRDVKIKNSDESSFFLFRTTRRTNFEHSSSFSFDLFVQDGCCHLVFVCLLNINNEFLRPFFGVRVTFNLSQDRLSSTKKKFKFVDISASWCKAELCRFDVDLRDFTKGKISNLNFRARV